MNDTTTPRTIERPSHEQRVVDEHAELLGRLRKLRAFITDEHSLFGGLPQIERASLMLQETVMTEYAEILAERIQRFGKLPQPMKDVMW